MGGLVAVDPAQIVREPAARQALAQDPAIQREKVPARTIATILAGFVELQPPIPGIQEPLLIPRGGADKVTDPAAEFRRLDRESKIGWFELARA